ncbi:MAG TPA: glycosyltransferase family 87 protein [Acidobacteriaceae bacterium]|nr:glycosyltransferase family 87 protein [Acidobacteriaceae bacterium]
MPATSYEVASLPKAEPRKIAVGGWTRFIPAIAISLVLVRSRIRGVGWPLPLYDFMTYWAAGKLFISGANPYSASAMYALERVLGWQYTQPLVLLNPPWTLPFIAPLGALSFNTAHYLWWALSMFVEAASAIALWRYFGGESRKQWIALIIAVTFLPSGAAEHMGQITPLMLGALTIFLLLMRRRREVIAGVFLIGLGLKPHLLYLVMLAVILWTIESRRWKLAIAAISSYAAATLGAIVFNHQVLKYAHGTTQAALDTSCGVGGALRSLFGTQLVWLQFLPTLAGVAWFAFLLGQASHCMEMGGAYPRAFADVHRDRAILMGPRLCPRAPRIHISRSRAFKDSDRLVARERWLPRRTDADLQSIARVAQGMGCQSQPSLAGLLCCGRAFQHRDASECLYQRCLSQRTSFVISQHRRIVTQHRFTHNFDRRKALLFTLRFQDFVRQIWRHEAKMPGI